MATTVEVLASAFKEAGTPFIVGHPGGELVELMEAGRQRQMRFLLMKQEVAGAMLAATWGEITGSPGVCLSTRGPGRRQHGQRRGPCAARPRAPDRHHRRLLAAHLRDRAAPAHRPAGRLCPARQVEHRHRRQDRAPAGAPRHARRHRCAAGAGAFRAAAERDDARGRRVCGRAAAAAQPRQLAPRPGRPRAGLGHAAPRQATDPDGGPRRALGRRLARAGAACRAAGRAGAHHLQVQGRDPRGPCLARRLHHRRPDRAHPHQ